MINNIKDFIGQDNIKQDIGLGISYCKKHNTALKHMLFLGNPGLGKSTLAKLVAKELGVQINIIYGTSIKHKNDLKLLLNIPKNSILFIDEIHMIPPKVMEILYPILEEGKFYTSKGNVLTLEPYTIIGATTHLGLLKKPLIDRFSSKYYLEDYTYTELKHISKKYLNQYNIKYTDCIVSTLADISRGIPRNIKNFSERIHEYCSVYNIDTLNLEHKRPLLALLGVDAYGCTQTDKAYIKGLYVRFNGGPVGLQLISDCLYQDTKTVSEVIEPHLLKKNFVNINKSGRHLTAEGIAYAKTLSVQE